MKIIVVGGSGTIGSAVVKTLEAKRHEVIGASRKAAVKVDLENAGSVRAMFEQVKDVDAVVCCAGDAAFRPFAELTDTDYQLGLRSKLMGQVGLARIAKDYLREDGSITLTSGVLAQKPMAGSAAVSLVNAALEGFVRAAALELPRRLRINVVSPPWVRETLIQLHMDPNVGLPAAEVAKAYAASVEGDRQGSIIEPGVS
ncbi:MAG: short chain dehydrogenase [Acidobacteria bacterium]|nr:MAG: short chain dehydrogenase [Acidobacteriota bacterium]